MQISISGAKQLGPGVWSAVVDRDELSFLGGRPSEGGRRSVVLVTAADYASGSLQIQPSTSAVANVGTTNEVIFVDRLEARPQVRGEDKRPFPTSMAIATMAEAPDADGSPNFFWVTIGKGLQENYEIAMNKGVWGVPSKYANRIQSVEDGDFIVFYGKDIGFSLCRVSGAPFEDRSRVWPDGVYPYRVKISPPIHRSHGTALGDVFDALLDREGRHYTNVNAAGRAIGGAAGVFRPVEARERQRLFRILQWPLDSEGGK